MRPINLVPAGVVLLALGGIAAAAQFAGPAAPAAPGPATLTAAYERCRSTLDQDPGIPPSPATRQRHAALLAAVNGDHPPVRAGEQSR